jgi:hypothetical protein
MLRCQACLGGYFATIGGVKARWVPEKMRATIYNFFRVPLNLLVVANELLSPSTKDTFCICTVLLLLAFGAFLCANRVVSRREKAGDTKTESAGLISPP